ncbi:MAG TPA: DNA-directed RNA polymerase subunit omega [Blastocatellia bacterium]|nr:DNA-directed RNA polymerase subunit omega [Blastocatellia bacterium]
MPEEKVAPIWLTEVDSKYRLVILAARRSKQIQKGARSRTVCASKKATKIALEEVSKGLVRYERTFKRPTE